MFVIGKDVCAAKDTTYCVSLLCLTSASVHTRKYLVKHLSACAAGGTSSRRTPAVASTCCSPARCQIMSSRLCWTIPEMPSPPRCPVLPSCSLSSPTSTSLPNRSLLQAARRDEDRDGVQGVCRGCQGLPSDISTYKSECPVWVKKITVTMPQPPDPSRSGTPGPSTSPSSGTQYPVAALLLRSGSLLVVWRRRGRHVPQYLVPGGLLWQPCCCKAWLLLQVPSTQRLLVAALLLRIGIWHVARGRRGRHVPQYLVPWGLRVAALLLR